MEETKKNENVTKEKMSPKEKKYTILISAIGSLILLGSILFPVLGHFSDQISPSKPTIPSFSWDNQKPGVYDEKKLFRTSNNIFSIQKSNDDYLIKDISLEENDMYLVFPSSVKDENGNYFSITATEKESVHENLVSSSVNSLKGIYFPSLYTTIGASSFANMPKLEEVRFGSGEGNQTIQNRAFENAVSLKEISFSKNLVSIGAETFKNNTSLLKVNLLFTSLKTLGEGAFSGCSSLKEIYLPSSLISLPSSLFASCSSLTKIHYAGKLTAWANLPKDSSWMKGSSITEIICSDGGIQIQE